MTPRFRMGLYLAIELLLVVVLLIYAVRGRLSRRKNKQNYPPGPTPRFLVGNWFDFPQRDDASQYIEWEKKYHSALIQAFRIPLKILQSVGSILHTSCLGQHFLILNSLEDAEALLEKRADIYSDRPDMLVIDR